MGSGVSRVWKVIRGSGYGTTELDWRFDGGSWMNGGLSNLAADLEPWKVETISVETRFNFDVELGQNPDGGGWFLVVVCR